jgi:signal transduction histidine kinase
MGLGLSIVRAIAGAHGGRVWAESSGPDQGSTFTIALNAA